MMTFALKKVLNKVRMLRGGNAFTGKQRKATKKILLTNEKSATQPYNEANSAMVSENTDTMSRNGEKHRFNDELRKFVW